MRTGRETPYLPDLSRASRPREPLVCAYPRPLNFPSPSRERPSSVLSIRPFRRLWIALSLSSLGDWLSIVALTVLASSLTSGGLEANGPAGSGGGRKGV